MMYLTKTSTFLYKIHKPNASVKRFLADDCAIDDGVLTIYRIRDVDGSARTVAVHICAWEPNMVIEACDPETELPVADYGFDPETDVDTPTCSGI